MEHMKKQSEKKKKKKHLKYRMRRMFCAGMYAQLYNTTTTRDVTNRTCENIHSSTHTHTD